MEQAGLKSSVLVLGDYMQSITVVRSLARAGLHVLVGRGSRLPFTRLSRHTGGCWKHPDITDADAFIGALAGLLDAHPEIDFVFPVGETEIAALSAGMPRLGGRVRVAMPSPDVVSACLDKPTSYRAAAAAGVPVPETFLATNHADLARRAADLRTRFVVKRPDSFGTLGEHKALVCDHPAELDWWRPEIDEADWPLVVQRFITGARHNCHFAAVDGRVVAYFEDRMLRSDRPDGTGYAVDGVSVPPSPSLRAHCDGLVERLGYSGVGCAQFLVNATTGEAAFLELNPRLDATCELPYRCGIDFPLLALQCVDGAAPDAPGSTPYPVGKRFHWLLGDLRGLVGGVRRGRLQGMHVFRAVGDLAKSHWHADARLTWAWSDPIPSCFLYGRELISGRPRFGTTVKRHA